MPKYDFNKNTFPCKLLISFDVAKYNRACSKIYKPVCGSDRITYEKQCVLNIATCESQNSQDEEWHKFFLKTHSQV